MRKKDPNAPKRPLSAYFAWLQENRARVKAENPDMKHKDVTAKLGEMWGALDEAVKTEYKDTASKQMEGWKAEFEEYKKTPEYADWQAKKAAEGAKGGKGKRKKKPPKDPNAPKRPSTGFFLFVADNREEVKASLPEADQKKVTLVTKKCGDMWKECSAEVKAQYKEKSTKLKQEYDEKLAAYKETADYANYQVILREFKKKQKEATQKPKKKVKRVLSDSESDSESS